MKIQKQQRRGAVVIESAIVLPIAITVVVAVIVGAFSIFVYQETASLVRGVRWAAVHGTNYQADTGNAAVTAADVYNNAIAPRMVSMDPNNTTYSVTWSPDKKPDSYVTVTVTYYLSVPVYGDLTLTSTSTEQIHW